MVTDRDTLWVVESARYYMGMSPEFMSAYKTAGGGIKILMPFTEPAVGKAFLQARCEKAGRKFNEPYWDEYRLKYECFTRYSNDISKNYAQFGVEWQNLGISATRNEWSVADDILCRWIRLPKDKWYDDKSGTDNRVKRIRQDNHSQAADSAVARKPRVA
jgi:hypothetical protein